MLTSSSFITVAEVAKQLNAKIANCDSKLAFNSVSFSSAEVGEGHLFVALRGTRVDGHDFINDAVRAGARACVVEDQAKLGANPGLVVSNTRRALSQLALLFSENASQKLINIGITGTNGKTTINWLIYQLLLKLGKKALRVGTLGIKTESLLDISSNLTTPDPLDLHGYFRTAHEAGVEYCVMEASSHALDQARVDDVKFDVAVFTNLTRDHLDYHKEMLSYFEAKFKLFKLLSTSQSKVKAAVVNIDCEYGQEIQKRLSKLGLSDLSYGESDDARLKISNFDQDFAGSSFELTYEGKLYQIRSSFIGKHNAHNIAATFATGLALGFKPETLCEVVGLLPQVPGRLEAVGNGEIGIYVDFAHTPDALENVLVALKALKPNALWVVFGCGGDRDRGKRPQMAEVARKLADKVVVTSDNPRTEDPTLIIADILSRGVKADFVEVDRRAAIKQTLQSAKAGDIVLIAGKGHEDYQIIGTEKLHFSDQEEVRKVLSALTQS